MYIQSLTGSAGTGDLKIEAKPDTVSLGAAYGLSPEQAAFFKVEARINIW